MGRLRDILASQGRLDELDGPKQNRFPKPIEMTPKHAVRQLPEDFKVYVKDGVILNWPAPAFEEITLPTYNHYQGADGGDVALYVLRDPKHGLYSVGDEGGSTIYVMGQIRVQGYYDGRIFIPTDGDRPYALGDNITRDKKILGICQDYFPEVTSDYWIGGDTGGWFGIQNVVNPFGVDLSDCPPPYIQQLNTVVQGVFS